MTTDILPEEVQENFPPEAVSPAVVWLCTDEAKEISGRQWLVAGNNVSLLSWRLTPIAQASADAEPWAVADIGEKILASKAMATGESHCAVAKKRKRSHVENRYEFWIY